MDDDVPLEPDHTGVTYDNNMGSYKDSTVDTGDGCGKTDHCLLWDQVVRTLERETEKFFRWVLMIT